MGYTQNYLEFVVDEVALGQGLIEVRHFLPVNVIASSSILKLTL